MTVDGEFGPPVARPATVAVFALLVVPLVLGTLDGRLWTPLAAPGYLLMMSLTIVGSVVVPQYEFWLYWPPFVLLCYGIAVGTGAGYYRVRSD